ncbi:hypothetical protein A2890_01075 [candidate division WWE3 bacterium RIFCSPLOWO2_01_FULL_53_14]|uniref:ABC3 transporter permease protein domain-containing protein n=1 Tax=candidate division WWE3 bacterium RIFCSPLOWO2_01_FULL_53_14 TaxID=1802628 RepID=A0A1F4VVQ3_UNCKA|nr:MAG: hypothetical protein A2890_01075 [candidate division WWE3 bacterium RIFCSPLOWO2_01_FULL_53_14]
MFFLARKNLLAEKIRLLISVGGVAFSVLLVVVVGGLYRGWESRITDYIESIDADLWVGQEGSGDMSHSFSVIPSSLGAEIEKIGGVDSAKEFVGKGVRFEHDGKETTLRIVGFDPATGENGPLKMVKGTDKIAEGEIIVDRSFAGLTGAEIGHTVDIAGVPLEIKGISTGGNLLVYSFAYVTVKDARLIFQLGDATNYFLVKTSQPLAVKDGIEDKFPQLAAFTKDDFLTQNRSLITDTFLPIIQVLFIIAFIIGVAVVGLTIYTATIEKSREYGVLKAIGATNWQLYLVILVQSFIAGILGYFAGVGLGFVAAQIAEYFVPGFITEIVLSDLVSIFGAALLMSFIAVWLPVQRIARIDPASVFKA